jgi:hypothetical protein
VERYEVQLRATDASGVAVELDSGDPAVWTELVPGDEPTRAAFANLHRPKTWYYQTRVRALNRVWTTGVRCYSAWSAWTAATQPAGGALTGPPAPTGVALTFARTEPSKTRPFTATVVGNEVPNWTPTDGDLEEGASSYLVQLAASNDGGSSTVNVRELVIAADDTASTFEAQFVGVKRGRSYRARVKPFLGQTAGAFSSWTAWRAASTDVGSGPNAAINIHTTKPKPRVLLTTWDPPTVGEDVDEFRVRVYRGAELRETVFTRTRRHRYEVPDEDAGKGHRVKVTALDENGLASTEADEGTDIEEGGTVSATILTPGTLAGSLTFGGGQISEDGTVQLPNVPATGFLLPAIQQVCKGNFGALSDPATRAWNTTTKQGSLLLAWLVIDASTPTITPPAGWTLVGLTTQANPGLHGALYKIEDAAPRSGTESFDLAAAQLNALTLLEIVNAEIQDKTASNSGSSAAPSTGTTATTTQTGEIFLALFGFREASTATAPTNSYTERSYMDASPQSYIAAKTVTSTQTTSCAITLSGSEPWVGRVVTFKAKSGAATIDTPPAGSVGVYAKEMLSASRMAYKGDDGVDRPLGINIGFCAFHTAAGSHSSTGNFQKVALNSTEFNDGGIFDTVTDTFTVPVGFAGRWALDARIVFSADPTGVRQLRFLKNGTTELDLASVSTPSGPTYLQCSRIVQLAEGDTVWIQALQGSGGNLAYVGTTASQKRFSGTYIGPGG